MQPTRQRGPNHWTHRRPDLLPSWKKLPPEQRTIIALRFQAGESQVRLARDFGIGRTTIWRYLRAQGLVKIKTVPRLS